MAKVMIALNMAWNLYNFRAGLVRALVAEGHDVLAASPQDNYTSRLSSLGCRYVKLPMDNMGTHPGRDFILLCRFYFLLRKERPDVLLCYTVKPNIYGSLAAYIHNIPVVNNITGLGVVFIKEGWLMRFIKGLYQLALTRSAKVFFQNKDDLRLFVDGGLVKAKVTDQLPGSGVDLVRFSLTPYPSGIRKIRFSLIARMLWDKGINEFVDAARKLKSRYPNSEFCLIGFLDSKNPEAISRFQIDKWVAEKIVKYMGETDDIRPFIAKSDCVVLPSYREGAPRSLMEAAAMGRPIITTDTIGCCEIVDDGVNGYLCKIRDAEDLTKKLEQMIRLSPTDRAEMGKLGREKMKREFDEKIVTEKYIETINGIIMRDKR